MNQYLILESLLYGVSLSFSCLSFMLPLRKSKMKRFGVRLGLSLMGMVSLYTAVYYTTRNYVFSNRWSNILFLLLSYFGTVLFFQICIPCRKYGSWYCGIWGTVTCILEMELGSVCGFFLKNPLFVLLFQFTIVIISCLSIGFTIARWMPENGKYQIGPKQMLLALVTGSIIGESFLFGKFEEDNLFSSMMIQCYCLTVLYMQSALFKKSSMSKELETLQFLWNQQKAQYQLTKENIDLINHKCHDLKHQIRMIQTIKNEQERENYLKEVERSVQIYNAIVRTGNEILDTILTEKSLICENQDIHINCVADGMLLSFMDPVDLYTLFGNALDNAIEAVEKVINKQKRVIDIMLYRKKNFLIIQIINPMCEEVQFEDGLPLTTKIKNGYHGYGMKSIRHTLQKYDGYLTVEIKDGCFFLKSMIPLKQNV